MERPFYIIKGNVYAIPVTHYNMEMASEVRRAFLEIKPDCVAVELAQTMELQLLHAASRLPDISIVTATSVSQSPIYYLCEPCDAAFEGLRSGLEKGLRVFCIDLDVDGYPDRREHLPDPYSIYRIGLQKYYGLYHQIADQKPSELDKKRELHMAKRLKELSFSYDKILFVGGMAHVERVLELMDQEAFPILEHAIRDTIHINALTEKSVQEVMAEPGWITRKYEQARQEKALPIDRQKLIYQLYKQAADKYVEHTGNAFQGYHLRNIMKFVRNYALVTGKLLPDLFQILAAAKGCVDHNYAYEVWVLGTEYPYLKNVDNLPELDLSIEDVWGDSKIIRFHLREKGRKNILQENRKRKDKANFRFRPPGMFTICSYPPEDLVIEKFGDFLKKKGTQILTEDASRSIPFSSSIEDGVDTKETIRHWHEKKLYVKVKGKPPGGVGSVVIVFDEDSPEGDDTKTKEKYPWRTTWIGEHSQESDMAFFATPFGANVVGPGISRCEYGGFMMSYPPRRMMNIWNDPDYSECRTKAEVLLMAAIDYAVKPLIVYVASKPPRSILKSFAKRFGKKVVYIPIGQLSPVTLNKLRGFHVLDGHDKRNVADEYIF